MTKDCSITIVLPLYKPSGDWAVQFIKNVLEVNASLPAEKLHYIVVHDGPLDSKLKEACQLLSACLPHFTLLHYTKNRGKGCALRHGVEAATTPYVLLIDFDFPYETRNIAQLILQLRTGKDVVVGRRKRAYFRQAPLKRVFVSKAFSLLNRLFIPLPLFDTQSGIKGFNKRGQSVFLETTIDRFLIDTEFLMRVHKTNLTVAIIDVDLKPHITFSNFGVAVIKTELLNFLHVFRLSRKLPKRVVVPAIVVQPPVYALSA